MEYIGDVDNRRQVDSNVIFDPVMVQTVPFGRHFEVLEDVRARVAIKYRLYHAVATRHPFVVRLCEVWSGKIR